MSSRFQHTLAKPAAITGVGFLTGADITVRFLPAAANHGITFRRIDLADSVAIPALVDFTAPRTRRTALEHRGASVELIEHAMAALAGLQIDNCAVELNGPEVPGCDGSSRPFVDVLLNAGIETLSERRQVCSLGSPVKVEIAESDVALHAVPLPFSGLRITYDLDYGSASSIPRQRLTVDITPDSFVNDIAFARTFIMETEVQAFLAQGIGQRLSFQDLLIYGPQGVVGNELRATDECVRHKILDCVGDLALLGCDLTGHVHFRRTGHRHNAEFVRSVQCQQLGQRQQLGQLAEARCFRDAA